ncbi:hypothetical protein N0V92_003427 [Colletotrichum tropicale]|nr:hypothetical protein N0V92_003427 [Colletotrichum tropicale]
MVDRLRQKNDDLVKAYLHNEGNRHAVRIAAAGALETAWEDGEGKQRAGVMTRELARALREAWNVNDEPNQISWQKILLRVSELVNINFPRQNPYVEGPLRRMLFSLVESETNAIVLHSDGQQGILKAGRISGVREGNVYVLMPPGTERIRKETKIGEATVTEVGALEARAKLSILPNRAPISAQGVMAFLTKETLVELPVAHPEGPQELLSAINGSKFLRRRGIYGDLQDTDPLATHEEKLDHRLTVDFGTMKDWERQQSIALDGKGEVFEGESVYISLINDGTKTVHVSAFDINVSGKITLISIIKLDAGRAYHIGAGQFRQRPQGPGLSLGWPRDIAKSQSVPESLVFVLAASHVDLSVLAGGSRVGVKGEPGPSALEQLSYCFATGKQRDIAIERVRAPLRFDVLHVPFQIKARGIAVIS